MPTRVLAFYHRAETFGGSFNSVTEVLGRIDRDRFEVLCAVPGPGNVQSTFEGLRLPVHHWHETEGSKSPAYAWAVGSTAWRLRRHRIGLVYITDHITWRSSALFGARLAGVPTVVHLRSPREEAAMDPELVKAAMVVGNSEATVAALRPVRPPDRLRVIPNFVDFSTFQAPRHVPTSLFPGHPVVGFVGVFRPEKGIEFFLDMAKLIHQRRPDVRFLLVGGESAVANIGWFDRMRAYAGSLALGDACQFTGERSDIADLLATMDVVVVPSLNEGFGRVIVEANAVGKLVVGADAAGIPEVIEPGVSGLLAPPRDGAALAAAVSRILDDESWRRRASEELPTATRARFSPDALMARLQQAWDDALAYKRRA